MPKRPEKGLHYLVEFASRYARSPFQTLTAAAALWRAEQLAHDAQALLDMREAAELGAVRFGNRMGTYEIILYYAVGLVTCLEWHARSRLVDLMMFRPSSIEASDLKDKNIAASVISQMTSEGATIPHLLGAATKVSQLSEYLAIFRRIFRAINVQNDLEKQFRDTRVDIDMHRSDDDPSLFGALDRLFSTRNHLVHEIDQGIIGHFSIREMWSPQEALEYADAVISAIKAVELHITAGAPTEFPNRLNKDGSQEDELRKLSSAVIVLEAQLTTEIEKFRDSESLWNEALRASRDAIDKEKAYIEAAVFLHPVRHIDMRESAQTGLLKARLSFLRILTSNLERTMGGR